MGRTVGGLRTRRGLPGKGRGRVGLGGGALVCRSTRVRPGGGRRRERDPSYREGRTRVLLLGSLVPARPAGLTVARVPGGREGRGERVGNRRSTESGARSGASRRHRDYQIWDKSLH